MGILAKRSEDKNIIDTVFTMVNKAKDAKIKYGEEKVIDVTIVALYDENGNFIKLSPKNLVIFSFSCSKTLTKYGLRAGGSVFISNEKKNIDDYMRANEFTCRGIWSNVPKGGMKLFSTIQENKDLRDNLKKERDFYIELLKKRSKIFLDEAKETGLAVYPYKEGFFITLKIKNDKIRQSMEKLNAENIYPIQVASGIRIAICGSPSKKLKGLAERIKEILK